MAKPLEKLSKTTFLKKYNIVEVTNNINSIMKILETFDPKNNVIAFGTRRKHTLTLEDVIASVEKLSLEMRNGFKQINSRIDNLVAKNNLKE